MEEADGGLDVLVDVLAEVLADVLADVVADALAEAVSLLPDGDGFSFPFSSIACVKMKTLP